MAKRADYTCPSCGHNTFSRKFSQCSNQACKLNPRYDGRSTPPEAREPTQHPRANLPRGSGVIAPVPDALAISAECA